MRTRFAILLAITGLFMTALSADVSTTLPSENVRAHSEKFYDNLSERMLMANTTQPIPVIVMLNSTATTGAVNRLQALTGGFKVKHVYSVIPGFATALTTGQIAALARDATVYRIEYDDEVHTCLGTAQEWFGTAKARTDFEVDGDMDGEPTEYTKDDVVIAMLDGGIDTTHMDLDGGKVIGWKDIVYDSVAPYDNRGHGTWDASIAAGTGDANPTYKGVAPGAALVGVKVVQNNGYGTESDAIAGIDWVVTNKDTYNIRVLNAGVGSHYSSDGTDALSMACNNAVDAGIVVCVAAGNHGPETYSIGKPAAAEKVITVGGMQDPGEDGIWGRGFHLLFFSGRGPTADDRIKPDICADGDVTGARANSDTGYCYGGAGTSLASAFVAGTAALMLAANPSLTPAEVKSILMSTAQDWGPPGKDIDYGSGRLQGYDAVKEAGNYTGDGPVVPEHAYRSDKLGKRKPDIWEVEVDDLSYPIAVTMIMPDWESETDPDFDMYLYDPSGNVVAAGWGGWDWECREEFIGHWPAATGFYELWVTRVSGSGNYFFDLSCANASSVIRTQNGFGPQAEPVALSQSSLELVPNPAKAGRVAVRYSLPHAGQMTVTVVDISGRVVQTQEVAAGLKGSVSIDVSGLSAGVYMARLVAGDMDVSQPLVIAR